MPTSRPRPTPPGRAVRPVANSKHEQRRWRHAGVSWRSATPACTSAGSSSSPGSSRPSVGSRPITRHAPWPPSAVFRSSVRWSPSNGSADLVQAHRVVVESEHDDLVERRRRQSEEVRVALDRTRGRSQGACRGRAQARGDPSHVASLGDRGGRSQAAARNLDRDTASRPRYRAAGRRGGPGTRAPRRGDGRWSGTRTRS